MTESLEEKFRLQYCSRFKDVVAINWAFDRAKYVLGDCYVRAIREETDIAEHNRIHCQKPIYTEPMALAEAQGFISENKRLLGSMIHDCVGLQLEDTPLGSVSRRIIFPEPIIVRNGTSEDL